MSVARSFRRRPADAGRSGGRHLLPFVLACTLGCQAPSKNAEPSPIPLGQVVTRAPALLLPGLGWRRDGDDWVAERRPKLLLWLAAPAAAPVTLEIELARAPEALGFVVDGVALAPELANLAAEDPSTATHWSLRLGVPDPLAAGLHTVELTGAGAVRLHDARLNGLATSDLSQLSARRWRLLAEQLERGVMTVSGRERAAAIAFAEPYRREYPLAPAGAFSVLAINASDEPARFRVEWGATTATAELAAGERRRLEVADAHAASIALEVDTPGTEQRGGPFFWAAPRLRGVGQDRPPIVLITLDTFRRDLLATYRNDQQTFTPELDELAREATVFTRAYATSPWTLPSHASIMTGLYPIGHGAGVWTSELDVPRATLAERLRDAGYETLGAAGGFFCGSSRLMARGFDRYLDPNGLATPGAELVAWLDRVIGWRDLGRHDLGQLFLFVNLFDAHYPYRAPGYRSPATGGASNASFVDLLLAGDGAAFRRLSSGAATLDRNGRELLLAAYRAEASEVDRQVGRLFDRLRDAGIWDRALIVVTADHGEQFGENGLYGHSHRLTPELVEIPLLIKWPGQRRGATVTELASLVDLFHTVLAVAGLGPVRTLESLDLGDPGALRGRRHIRFEEHEAPLHDLFDGARLGAHVIGRQELEWRSERWEAGVRCWGRSGNEWLPESCPDAVRPLAPAELGPPAPAHALDEESRRALEALGYLKSATAPRRPAQR